MRARFLGKDPQSGKDGSPTLFATDREDRASYLVQGWRVTDASALQDVGDIPAHETIVEIPAEIIDLAIRHRQEQEDRS
ncbi:hypothetical protein AB1046_23060 [Promicromonospora sp. Populi]|uniref:hypothetical protein n=1 Tax=Promicromonospora sp. Populi TaxID=3239420 RepID=UPI0034E25F34